MESASTQKYQNYSAVRERTIYFHNIGFHFKIFQNWKEFSYSDSYTTEGSFCSIGYSALLWRKNCNRNLWSTDSLFKSPKNIIIFKKANKYKLEMIDLKANSLQR